MKRTRHSMSKEEVESSSSSVAAAIPPMSPKNGLDMLVKAALEAGEEVPNNVQPTPASATDAWEAVATSIPATASHGFLSSSSSMVAPRFMAGKVDFVGPNFFEVLVGSKAHLRLSEKPMKGKYFISLLHDNPFTEAARDPIICKGWNHNSSYLWPLKVEPIKGAIVLYKVHHMAMFQCSTFGVYVEFLEPQQDISVTFNVTSNNHRGAFKLWLMRREGTLQQEGTIANHLMDLKVVDRLSRDNLAFARVKATFDGVLANFGLMSDRDKLYVTLVAKRLAEKKAQ